MELAIAFMAGFLLVMWFAENPRLDEITDKELINRMADKSRAGWGKGKRMRYVKAGWRK